MPFLPARPGGGLVPLEAHAGLGWILVIATLACVGFWVPPAEKEIGESYLIFFFHFPSAINCLNFFFFGGVASAYYLIRRTPGSDLWAASAVEVGRRGPISPAKVSISSNARVIGRS